MWGNELSDISEAQSVSRSKDYVFPRTIVKADLGDAAHDELSWVKENAMDIKDSMITHGAVVFRGFETMKTQPGFVEVRN